jgi:hypothetical protein
LQRCAGDLGDGRSEHHVFIRGPASNVAAALSRGRHDRHLVEGNQSATGRDNDRRILDG